MRPRDAGRDRPNAVSDPRGNLLVVYRPAYGVAWREAACEVVVELKNDTVVYFVLVVVPGCLVTCP